AASGVLLVAILLMAFAGAGSSATAGTTRADLSTRASVLKYLRAHGVDARGFVFQHGRHNYAGPSCPGRGWTCTTARPVVQFAAADDVSDCTPGGPGTDGPNLCVIVQSNTTGDNTATCTEHTTSSGQNQSCRITQSNVSGNNDATVDQQIADALVGELSV